MMHAPIYLAQLACSLMMITITISQCLNKNIVIRTEIYFISLLFILERSYMFML